MFSSHPRSRFHIARRPLWLDLVPFIRSLAHFGASSVPPPAIGSPWPQPPQFGLTHEASPCNPVRPRPRLSYCPRIIITAIRAALASCTEVLRPTLADAYRLRDLPSAPIFSTPDDHYAAGPETQPPANIAPVRPALPAAGSLGVPFGVRVGRGPSRCLRSCALCEVQARRCGR